MQRAQIQFVVAWLLAAAVAAWCIADVWPFFADDAFLSLRYADRLVAGHGLTWTDGERVEGYSNLAWVLANALFGCLGMSTAVAARVLGVGCMAGVLMLLAWRFRRTPAAGVAVLLAATTPFAPWTIGGLELPLLMLCTTGGLLVLERAFEPNASARALLVSGGCFAIAACTRPDAPLLPAVSAVVLFLHCWSRRREGARPFASVLWLLLPVAVAVLGQLGFRVVYYGDWLANSARVKVGDGAGSPSDGLAYVQGAVAGMSALCALAGLGTVLAVRSRTGQGFVAALAAIVVAWAGYLVVIGGDFFPAFRLAVPMLPALALLTGLGLEQLATGGRGRCLFAGGLAIAAVVLCRVQTMQHPQTGNAAQEVWEFDGLAIGAVLGEAFSETLPLVAVDAAGAMPYASRLPSLDMLGLCDATIARDPLRARADSSFARAHRRGSANYLLGRAPDLFVFGRAPGDVIPLDAAGRALVDDVRFVADYRCAWLEVPAAQRRAIADGPLLVPMWLRVHGRCGVQPRAHGVEIGPALLGGAQMVPGFRPEQPEDLLARPAWERAVAQLLPWLSQSAVVVVEPGAALLEVRRAGEYRFVGLRLPPGSYELAMEPQPSVAVLELRRAGVALPRDDARWVVASPADELEVVFTVTTQQVPLRLRSIACRRE